MNKLLLVLIAVLLLLPLEVSAYQGNKARRGTKDDFRQTIRSKMQEYQKQQKEENRDFRKSLKNSDLNQEQKVDAIKGHRQAQYEENVAFRDGIHKESIAHLSAKLADNTKLTEEQKQGILQHRQAQYQENVAFRDQKHSEDMAAIDRILGDANLTPEERKTQMREYRKERKEEGKTYRKEQREENREFRRSFRPEPEQ